MRHGGDAALFADLYELTMAASYFRHGMLEPATFELVVRGLPPHRNYLVACGLGPALDYLARLEFDPPAGAVVMSSSPRGSSGVVVIGPPGSVLR